MLLNMCAGLDVAEFKAYPGKYISGVNIEKVTEVSVYECAQKCKDLMTFWYENRCASFDYDTKQRICYLSDRNTETVVLGEALLSDPDFVYYERGQCAVQYYFSLFDCILHKSGRSFF